MRGQPNHCGDYFPGVAYGPLLLAAPLVASAASAASATAAAGSVAATALTAASVAGTAISAVGSYASAMHQAGIMKMNAGVASQNAQIAGMQGQFAQYQQGLKTGQEVGQQTADFAAGGISTQSAGAANVIAGTRQAGVSDQSMLRFNTDANVQNFNTQAQQDNSNANATSTAAPISAFGTILGGASSVGNQWLMYQKFGMPNFGTVN